MRMILDMPAGPVSSAPKPARFRQARVFQGSGLTPHLTRWQDFAARKGETPLSRHPAWLCVLREAFHHVPYALEVQDAGRTRGFLPLALVDTWLFGRFLVSLPYLNLGGIDADDAAAAAALVKQAVSLADDLRVKYLELRHEQPLEHPSLCARRSDKVHMRLALPATADNLWKQISAKVRNQVRKGQKSELTVSWGTFEELPAFYDVFSRNMRDLGTPVYGRGLFEAVLKHFPVQAEFCVVRAGKKPVAAGLVLHGQSITEVPSASSLREFNSLCANMLLYWNLLVRAVERGQSTFDFGRSTIDGNTYKFKKQWGAEPSPAHWQYYDRSGSVGSMRPDNPRYERFIRLWKRLPVSLTRWIGPSIVRGIP